MRAAASPTKCLTITSTNGGTAQSIAIGGTVQMLLTESGQVYAKTGVGLGGWTKEHDYNVHEIAVGSDGTQMISKGGIYARNTIGADGWVYEGGSSVKDIATIATLTAILVFSAVPRSAVAQQAERGETSVTDALPDDPNDSAQPGATSPAKRPAPPKLPEPKGAKRLSSEYDVWVDPKEKKVIIDGQVSLREGMLECGFLEVADRLRAGEQAALSAADQARLHEINERLQTWRCEIKVDADEQRRLREAFARLPRSAWVTMPRTLWRLRKNLRAG